MEESEKRRERLRAMRMEAQQQPPTPTISIPPQTQLNNNNSPLTNPLLDSNQQQQSSSSSATTTTTSRRFDYYTDPMAAYSRTPHPLPPSHSGPRNSEIPFSGPHQMHSNYAPPQSFRHGDISSSPNPSQVGVRTPYHGQQVSDPYYRPCPSASPMGFRSQSPMHQGSPGFSPASGYGGSPHPIQGSPTYRPPLQGRGPWYSNSPSPGQGHGVGPNPGLGRGRGQWDGRSPGANFSAGRGRGRGHDFNSQSRSYYDKSMVEDPWFYLTPILWQGGITVGSVFNNRGSGQMNSNAKRARVSNSSGTPNAKFNLAEFLAAAADETVEADS